MSKELDEKLREILQTPHTDSTGSTVMTFPTQKTLDELKQAFALEALINDAYNKGYTKGHTDGFRPVIEEVRKTGEVDAL